MFSGTLDFRPNVDAVNWFVREVLPRVRVRRPDARLLVVGKRPAPALRRLANEGALVLTGEVSDVRPYLAGAAVYALYNLWPIYGILAGFDVSVNNWSKLSTAGRMAYKLAFRGCEWECLT